MSLIIHDAIMMVRDNAIDQEIQDIKHRTNKHHWFCEDTKFIFNDFLDTIHKNQEYTDYYLLPLRMMRDNYHEIEIRAKCIHKVMKHRLRRTHHPSDIGYLAILPNDVLYIIADKLG